MQGGFGFYYGSTIAWKAYDYKLRYGHEPKTLDELFHPDSQLQHDLDKAEGIVQHLLDVHENTKAN